MQQETGRPTALEVVPHPITKPWAIAEASRLGGDFLQWLLCDAGVVRRQAAFMVAARGWFSNPEGIVAQLQSDRLHEPSEALADLLRYGSLQDVIRAAYGSIPLGLIEAFNRIGFDALSGPAKYEMFYGLFADRQHRSKLKVARYVGRLTEERLQILFELPLPLLRPQFVRRVATLEKAKEVTAAYEAILEHAAPEAIQAITAAAHDAPEEQPIHKMIQTWVRHARFPPAPVQADFEAGFLTASSAAEQAERAIYYGNCSGGMTRLIGSVRGTQAYYAFEPPPSRVATAMIMLVKMTDGSWLIEGIYGPGNARVSPEVRATVVEWFAARGIHGINREPLPKPWETVLALAGHRRAFFDLQDEAEFLEDLG